MYCGACGKQIVEGSKFCSWCGTPAIGVKSGPIEWEEQDFVYEMTGWGLKGGWFRQKYVFDKTDSQIKLEVWQQEQRGILKKLQSWLDEGWEAVTEVGPAGIQLTTDYKSWGFGDKVCFPKLFRVSMRRRKQSKPTD